MNKPTKKYVEWLHWVVIFGTLMGFAYYESCTQSEQPLPVYKPEVAIYRPDSLMISQQ